MATIRLRAWRAERSDCSGVGFTSVIFDGHGLGATSAEARTVDEAAAAVQAFAAAMRVVHPATASKGFTVSAQWPGGTRKPRGWDAAWKTRLSVFVFGAGA